MNESTVYIAAADTEIAACYPVMRELRPHISEEEFVARVRRLEAMGYRLAVLQDAGKIVAVAGFRISESLSWGRFLYVDDLVTRPDDRSRGYGAKLLAWLKEFAAREGCAQLHLDSATWRKDAHRFYERNGMELTSFHFSMSIVSERSSGSRDKSPQRKSDYIHGTEPSEQERLEAQAKMLGGADFLPELKAGMRVLDVGCGTGAIAREVAVQVFPGEVVGLDLEEAQIKTARQMAIGRNIENVRFVRGDASALSFADGTFDGAYARFLLEHVADPLSVVQEMVRVIKPGGWVCAYEWENGCFAIWPASPAIEEVWQGIYRFQAARGGDPWVARKLYGIFRQAGLAEVRVEGRPWTITADEKEKLRSYINGACEIIRQTRQGLLAESLVTTETLRQAEDEYEILMESSSAFVFHGFCRAIGKRSE